MSKLLSLIATAAALFAAAPANAQQSAADYPDKPVKVVVTVPAGGGVDTVTRIVTERLRAKLGQPFVIENKGGAGGNIAAESVFQAEPDGYTLMASQPAPLTTNVVLYKKLNFDPTAFEPVAIMSSAPNVLLVKNDFPAKTLAEFMTYVKANPGKLNYASQGPGTTSHLTAELFNKLAGTNLVHVPYKGTGPALIDIAAGHVDLIFMQLEAAIKLHEGGKARILACHHRKAHRFAAGHSDHGRGRTEGLHLRHLERDQRAAQDAKANRRQAQRSDQRRAQNARGPGAVSQAAPATGRRHAAGHGEDHEGRHRALERGDQAKPRSRRSRSAPTGGLFSRRSWRAACLAVDTGAADRTQLASLPYNSFRREAVNETGSRPTQR